MSKQGFRHARPYPPILGETHPSPPKLGAGGASASQGMAVEREDLSFALHSLLQDAQLAAADGGQDIAQAVVFEAKVSWTNCCSRPDMWGREREIHVRGQIGSVAKF